MSKLLTLFEDALDGKALDWLGSARSELAADAQILPQIFPQLPRRLGRGALGSTKLPDSLPGGGQRELDLSACEMEVTTDGEVVSRGTGAAALGSPLNCVTWLANALAADGGELRLGCIGDP